MWLIRQFPCSLLCWSGFHILTLNQPCPFSLRALCQAENASDSHVPLYRSPCCVLPRIFLCTKKNPHLSLFSPGTFFLQRALSFVPSPFCLSFLEHPPFPRFMRFFFACAFPLFFSWSFRGQVIFSVLCLRP